MESICLSLVGIDATRSWALISRLCASLRFTSMLTIILSTARIMLCLIARSDVFSSSTTGFLSLLSEISLSRFNLAALYIVIWFSIFISLIPVFDGIRSASFFGSVRYSFIYCAKRNCVSSSKAEELYFCDSPIYILAVEEISTIWFSRLNDSRSDSTSPSS